MAEALREPQVLSVEDYLAFEQDGRVRHEFVNGVLYAMVGARDRHGLIGLTIASLLLTRLPKRCEVFAGDMKLRIRSARDEVFYYPDMLVSCSPTDREPYWREEPVLIAEVLSPSTERIDRTEKLAAYVGIPTLSDYVLIAQDQVSVELFRRANGWQREIVRTGEVRLDSVDLSIAVADLYSRTDLVD